jgi:hypothetical protein
MQADGAGWNARDRSGAGDQVLLAQAWAGPEAERDEGLKMRRLADLSPRLKTEKLCGSRQR